MKKEYGFSTLQVRAGYTPEATTGAFVTPIYQTAGYQFESVADAVAQFELQKPGSIYSRIANPTVASLENRLTALEKGVGTVCFASGMAAIVAAILTLSESGSEIVAMSKLYGGTYTLLFDRFEKRYGIRARQVDIEDLAALSAAINEKTRCVYIETLGNPVINIPDFEQIARIAHAAGLPLIADNTFGTPYLLDAAAHGIDIVVHSLTKYAGGHGSTVGGSVTDLGTFSFKDNPRFAEFNEPDHSYHGLVYAALDERGYTAKLRAGFLRDTGACLSPFAAFLLLQGLETLSLRMERHCRNTLQICTWLKDHPRVAWVNYPGLSGDAYFDRAQKYFPRGAGGIFTFGVKGGLSAGKRFIEALSLFSFVANVADVRSMVVHPASTTHSQLTEEEMVKAGVTSDMVRVSVGIEDVKDLIEDLDQALAASAL